MAMEAVVSTSLSGIMSSLVKLVVNEWCVEKTMKDELTNLYDELMNMDAFLEDVSSVPPDQLESQVKLRAREVRELSHAIGTHLHSFMARIESTKGALLPSVSKVNIQQEMDRYVKEIMKKVEKVSKRYGPYPCKSALESTSSLEVSTRMFATDTRESNHVGLEGAIAELTKKLSKSDHVSIVGMGGMGKTTLARAVYDKMKGDFDCGAFVPIGQRADMKRVLMYIFDGLHMEIYGHEPDQHQLTNQLQSFLVDKRCSIVIDDIWDKETWNFVELVFKGCAGIKIITTTRNRNIVKGVSVTVYTMKPLSPADSKELLRTKAQVKSHDAEFDTLSDQVLCKCGGVPIAITMIGVLLAEHQSKEWHGVYDSIGFDEHKEDGAFQHIRKVLSYSYYALPYNIKRCFLYLSLFPEDHWIEKNMLIWRWVAEGLVPEGSFEIGETYFKELMDRCMIQWAVSPHDPSQGGCRVHILMLRVIRDLSSSENFSTVLGLGMKQESISRTIPIHRLAIHEGEAMVGRSQNSRLLEVREVLSLYASTCPGSSLPPLREFENLRVMDLERCDLSLRDSNLEQLGRLKVLKYVGLVGIHMAELPRRIGRLKLLEILDVTATSIRELPPFVEELRKLRCLRAGKGTRMMGRVGMLTCLEELWLHSADKSPDFAAELQKLSEMRALVIHLDEVDEGMQKKLVVSLHKLRKLQVLQVWSDAEEKARLGGRDWEGSVPSSQLRQLLLLGIILPRPMPWIHHSRVPKLSKLVLQVETLEVQHVQILGQMPSLRSLCLHIHCYGNRLLYTAGKHEFMVLAYLYVTNIELICGEGALPRIQELEVGGIRVGTDVGLRGNMPLLERVSYHLDCWGCSPVEVINAEEELKQASQAHPNSPVLTIKRWDGVDVCSIPFQGAAQLSEEATKSTINPLLSGAYGQIPQAGYLDCSGHTTTRESPHHEAMEPTSLPMILLQKISNNFSTKRLLGQGHRNTPTLTMKRSNADGPSRSGSEYEGQVSTNSISACISNQCTTNVEPHPPRVDTAGSTLSLLNSTDGAALLLEEAPKSTIGPLPSSGYCDTPQAGNLDCRHTTTGERSPSEAMELTSLTMTLLQKITNNFSKERLLGEGGYGKVYLGVRDDGQEIAVKLLNANLQTIDNEQFTHKCNVLDWQTRYKIIKGTCEGVKYLHEGLEKPFYHLDLKLGNILLDENMAPKLADFGLSKLFNEEQTCRVTQNLRAGTIGYMPPEYINGGTVSKKFDIFSLGVVMTKIIAGPSGHTKCAEMQHQEFLDQLYTSITQVEGNWRKSLKETWSSPKLLDAQCRQVKICTEIALSCMKTDRHERPSIVDIINDLNETETFIENVSNCEQDPSLLTSTSNSVQPAASPPPSTQSPPPSPTSGGGRNSKFMISRGAQLTKHNKKFTVHAQNAKKWLMSGRAGGPVDPPLPPPLSPTPSAIATLSNVLALGHDEIDVTWDAKDQFPDNSKAEVCYNPSCHRNQLILAETKCFLSFVAKKVAGVGEEEDLPVESSARVQEMFGNTD
ncbi:Disease susceptibility protein LOV1 [Triticum urartu]|uniref:non-specific serine/threonine protein kinase n=1 Tax=Triticum urartu TaxID=4572 RepID=M7YQ18_TRIUA|nr:Disease susceptibility protein LOV1 [Triticum urartu]